MFTKSITAEVKDLDDKGLVKFYFSIFSNIDLDNDITEPGAFAKTISDWKSSNKKRIRHFKNHRWDQTPGVLQDLYEDEKGGVAVSRLILGTQLGKETYEEYKAGAITEHSFGYDIIESFFEETENGKIQHLKQLKLEEVSSLNSWGANAMTDVIDMKNKDQIMKLLEKLENLKKGDFTDQYFEKLEIKIAAVQKVLKPLAKPGNHFAEPIKTALKHSTLFNQ
jgi:HK97 family phage prohead protease